MFMSLIGTCGTGSDPLCCEGLFPASTGPYRERAKIHNALGQFTNDWINYGVSIVFDGWTNVKGRALTNILGVFSSGLVFLSAHDYSNC